MHSTKRYVDIWKIIQLTCHFVYTPHHSSDYTTMEDKQLHSAKHGTPTQVVYISQAQIEAGLGLIEAGSKMSGMK